MHCRTTELRFKDVINVKDGYRLGHVEDVEIDTESAELTSIVILGRSRWMGILGRDEDIVIRWEDIVVIGEDTILVNYDPHPTHPRKNNYRIF